MAPRAATVRPQVRHLEDRVVPAELYSIFDGAIVPPNVGQNTFTAEQILEELGLPAPPVAGLAVGYGNPDGPWRVRVYENSASYREFTAYDIPGLAHTPTIHVATGDVTGDGVDDVITGMTVLHDRFSPSLVPAAPVKVFDGTTLGTPNPVPIAEFRPYEILPSDLKFYGGTFVATADINNDGKDEVITCRDGGGVGRVRVFDGDDLRIGKATMLSDFDGIEGDPNATDGAHIATGDISGDGKPDLVVGAINGPRVAVFHGVTLRAGATPQKVFGDFFAFDPGTFDGGIHVAVSDLDADGHGELLAGAHRGAPRMVCFDGRTLAVSAGVKRIQWWDREFGDQSTDKGLRLIGKELDGQQRGDLALSHGEGAQVTIIRGALVLPGGPEVLGPASFGLPTPRWTHGSWVG